MASAAQTTNDEQQPSTPEPMVIDAGPGNDYEDWSRSRLQLHLNTITGFSGRYGTYSKVKLIQRIQSVESGNSTSRAYPKKRKAPPSPEIIFIPDSPPAQAPAPAPAPAPRKQKVSSSTPASSSQEPLATPRKTKLSPEATPGFITRGTRKPKDPRRLKPMVDSGAAGEAPGPSRLCGNVACKAKLAPGELFCRRCSCSICKHFDDNKDPALWIECSSPSCTLSSHLECALGCKAAGVVKQAGRIQLDASYSCQGCGWISCVLGSWKKLLVSVKSARRTDAFTSGLWLAFRLLTGSTRFRELDEIITGAVRKLEQENGPITSQRSTRGLVTRLSCGGEVQCLLESAIDRSASFSDVELPEQKLFVATGGALERVYSIEFLEVSSDSMVISWSGSQAILGEEIASHSIWCRAAATRAFASDPVRVVPGSETRFHLTDLLPGIEYVVRVVPMTRTGVKVGEVESRCSTATQEQDWGSVTEVCRRFEAGEFDHQFRIRELSKMLKSSGAQENPKWRPGLASQQENLARVDAKVVVKSEPVEQPGSTPVEQAENSEEKCRDIVPVSGTTKEQDETMVDAQDQSSSPKDEPKLPDLNIAQEQQDDHQGGQLEVEVRLNLDLNEAVAETFNCTVNEEVGALETSSSGKALEFSDQPTVINTQREPDSEEAAKNLEFSIRTIVWLEKEGHLVARVRLKLLTWLGIHASDEEKKLVYILVRTLMNEPETLAQQLVDTFQEIAASSPEMLARVIKRAS